MKPKAIVKKPVTSNEVKPVSAGGINSLSGVSGLAKGGVPVNETLEYTEGDRVRHIKYGQGTVKKIEKAPRDFQVTVEFDAAGDKIMFAAFAKLKKMD